MSHDITISNPFHLYTKSARDLINEVLSRADGEVVKERPCDYVLRILSNLYVPLKDRGTLFKPHVTVEVMRGLIRPAFIPFIRKLLLACANRETKICLRDKLNGIDVEGISNLADEKIDKLIHSFELWLTVYMPAN